MKKLLLIPSVSILLLSSCGPDTHNDKYRDLIRPGKANVILVTGQSNASGNSPWEFLHSKNPTIYSKFKNGVTNVLTSYYVHDNNNYEYFAPTKFGMGDAESLFGPEIGIADVFSEANGFT